MTIYTIIAYKPNKESYDSGMAHRSSENWQDIHDFIEEIEVKNAFLETREAEYEFTLIINGNTIPSHDAVNQEEYRVIKENVARRVSEIKKDQAEEKRIQDSKEREKQDVRDRAEYEKLKKKFEKVKNEKGGEG
jgi:hypothetical protein